MVCYFARLSRFRPGIGKFGPEDIDPSLCTHIMYAFVNLTDNFELAPFEPEIELSMNGKKGSYEILQVKKTLVFLLFIRWALRLWVLEFIPFLES